MDEEKPKPKLKTVEIVLISIYLILIDGIELILIFFGLDDFWLGDILASIIVIYLWFRGLGFGRMGVSWLTELIPWVGDLPLLTIGFWMTVYADRHPESAAAKAVQISQSAGGKKGMPKKSVQTPRGGAPSEGLAKGSARGSEAGQAVSKTEGGLKETGTPKVSEEAFGIEKEPIEKVMDITRKLPEPQAKPEDDEEENDYRMTA